MLIDSLRRSGTDNSSNAFEILGRIDADRIMGGFEDLYAIAVL
jgi:hypothetical protein